MRTNVAIAVLSLAIPFMVLGAGVPAVAVRVLMGVAIVAGVGAGLMFANNRLIKRGEHTSGGSGE